MVCGSGVGFESSRAMGHRPGRKLSVVVAPVPPAAPPGSVDEAARSLLVMVTSGGGCRSVLAAVAVAVTAAAAAAAAAVVAEDAGDGEGRWLRSLMTILTVSCCLLTASLSDAVLEAAAPSRSAPGPD